MGIFLHISAMVPCAQTRNMSKRTSPAPEQAWSILGCPELGRAGLPHPSSPDEGVCMIGKGNAERTDCSFSDLAERVF